MESSPSGSTASSTSALLARLAVVSPLKRPHASVDADDDDEVRYAGEKTRAERDAELLREAVWVDDEDEPEEAERSTPPAQAASTKTEDEPSTPPPKQVRPPPAAVPAAQPARPVRPAPALDANQQRALEVALSGRNLFLTGGAGVGKSLTLRAIIDALVAKHGERHVAVTASTGCASAHVGGQTLHSLGGVGVPEHISDFRKLWQSARGMKAEAWRQMKALIVDEVQPPRNRAARTCRCKCTST